MKLQAYLKLIKKPPTVWARENKLSPATIWRVATGKTFPDPPTVRAIAKATEGAILPQDWY